MPPEIGKAGDMGTAVLPQAPVQMEKTGAAEIDKKSTAVQKQEPPRQDAETAAKNSRAAKQHATDTMSQDSARAQLLKNQLAQTLQEREKQPGGGQKEPAAPSQSNKTLKDQLAERIAKGPDGPTILPHTAPVQAGPDPNAKATQPQHVPANAPPQPVAANAPQNVPAETAPEGLAGKPPAKTQPGGMAGKPPAKPGNIARPPQPQPARAPKQPAGAHGGLTPDEVRAQVERHLNIPRPDPNAPMTVKTPRGSEKITFAEYERRWKAASEWVSQEGMKGLPSQSEILKRREGLYKLAQEKFGLQNNWQYHRNNPVHSEYWQHLPAAGHGASGGGQAGGAGNSGPVDPHASTQSRAVDPHGNTQHGPVDPHGKTDPGGAVKGAAAAEKEAGAAGKVAAAAEKGTAAGKAAGTAEKAAASAAKAAEGAGAAAKITSGGAKAAEAVAHMSPVADALMLEFDYFASFAKAHDIIRQRNTENGFAVGMAASLMGAPPEKFVLRAIDRDVTIQVLGAEGIGEKSHNKGVSDGYKYAQSLPAAERNKLREQAFKTLALRGYHTSNSGSFDQTDVIHTAGTMVPGVKQLFEETRKAAAARELQNRMERKPVYGSRF